MTRVYMDGVFDLFHFGHVRAIKQCREIGEKENKNKKCTVIIGLIADDVSCSIGEIMELIGG